MTERSYDFPSPFNAHDVRHLAVCTMCGDLGDKRRMISGLTHPRCFAKNCDDRIERILALPTWEREKFRLGDAHDVGIDNMRQIMESLK